MPLFRRRHTNVADFSQPAGTLPCLMVGCPNQTALPCSYRDRRGHVCPTAFCPDHRATVGGVVYCRRHAGTVTALGADVEPGALPELENRGPSLVNWVAAEINDRVMAILSAAAVPPETVQADATVAVLYDQHRRRRWERSWKLLENTGVSLKVSVQVAEDDEDALIDARVGSAVIARGVPPWVARRRAGQQVDAVVDAEQRELFRLFFLDHIAAEVARQRNSTVLTGGTA